MELSKPLTDNDPMPFGKHEGEAMLNVPASYLLWLSKQDWVEEKYPLVWAYIEDNYDILQLEVNN